MTDHKLGARLGFLKEAGRLKDTLRSGFTIQGRPESTAEHTWRLCLWVIVFADQLKKIDLERLLKLCVIHDLGEAINGDIPAIFQTAGIDKSGQERDDLQILLKGVDSAVKSEIMSLWEEYDAALTPEAKLAKGFDKLETLMTHNQGKNPHDFDYEFNLTYGSSSTEQHGLLQEIRKVIDADTTEQITKQKTKDQ